MGYLSATERTHGHGDRAGLDGSEHRPRRGRRIQRMESLATSSKPSRLRGKRLRVSTPLMAKRVRANEPSPSRERDRGRNLEPNLRKRVLRLVRARVRMPRPNLPSLRTLILSSAPPKPKCSQMSPMPDVLAQPETGRHGRICLLNKFIITRQACLVRITLHYVRHEVFYQV